MELERGRSLSTSERLAWREKQEKKHARQLKPTRVERWTARWQAERFRHDAHLNLHTNLWWQDAKLKTTSEVDVVKERREAKKKKRGKRNKHKCHGQPHGYLLKARSLTRRTVYWLFNSQREFKFTFSSIMRLIYFCGLPNGKKWQATQFFFISKEKARVPPIKAKFSNLVNHKKRT